MGCGGSSIVPYEPINLTEKEYHLLLLSMGFTRHSIDQMYTTFLQVDVDNTNAISPMEWLVSFNLEPTPIILSFLKILDLDGSGALNFTEFMFSCWNFLTLDAKTMGGFIFLMCESHTMFRAKTKKMENAVDIDIALAKIQSLHAKKGDPGGSKAVKDALNAARGRWKEHYLFCDQVQIFCYEHQGLILPLLRLRDKFRDNLMGRPFWEDLTTLRSDDEELDRYDYVHVIRDKLIKIELECLKKEEKLARKMEIDDARSNRGMRQDKKSFIQKHFGMHKSQIDHASDSAHGSNKKLAKQGSTDWDKKEISTKKNKYAVEKRLDGISESGGVKPSAMIKGGKDKSGKSPSKKAGGSKRDRKSGK